MHQELIVVAPNEFAFRDYAEPALKPNEVRVRTLVSGIKQGTEMNLVRGTTPFLDRQFDLEWRAFLPRSEASAFFPTLLGSWGVGEVIEVGGDVRRFAVGDRVHGDMLHRPTNVQIESRLLHAPEGASPEALLFTDPAIFALTAVHDAQIKVGDRVAVFGLGVLGLIALQIARLQGAERVFGVDTIPLRMKLAKQFGADEVFDAVRTDAALEIKSHTNKKGVDAAIEISGAYAGLHAAIKCVHQGGIVAAAGYYKSEQRGLELGAEWHHNRPTLVSSMPVWGNPLRAAPMWDLARVRETAARLVAGGRVQVAPMVTHHFAYADAPAAYELLDKNPRDAVKVVLTY